MKVLEVASFTSFLLAASAGEESLGIAAVLVGVSFVTGGIAYLLERKVFKHLRLQFTYGKIKRLFR